MENFRMMLTSPLWTSTPTASEWLWRPVRDWDNEDTVNSVSAAAPSDRRGQWTVVTRQGRDLRIDTDRLRSHHLLFTYVNGQWMVSDDPESLRKHSGSWNRDAEAADVFLHTGFVVGSRTLVSGVHATPAASTVVLHPDGTWTCSLWDSFGYSTNPITSAAEFDEAFDHALDLAVTRLLAHAEGRQLVLPLSGGLDSRLLAVWLKRLGAPRVIAYTYGKPGSREISISRAVAQALGIDWFSVDLDPSRIAQRWHTAAGAHFQGATWGLTSLPHVQDWYALTVIREDHLVDDDAIILPGHAAVRTLHDTGLLHSSPSNAQVFTAIARRYAVLQGSPEAYRALPLLREEIRRAETEAPLDRERGVQGLLAWFNLRERQAKYINNSMKAYEFFGYDWALPLLDSEVWDCWLNGSEELTANRDWYARYTGARYACVTGQEQELYRAPSVSMPAVPKRALLAAMRATGGDRLLSRVRSVRTMLDHPMAFEAFTEGIPRSEQAWRFARGTTSLGLWTQLFLDNQWGTDLVPSS
ncbi:asparagine synthetase B family protein [Actinomyces sp. 594]|uniref:asparagine synthase-related protein n=1 Tax=Actinomyces sp. 594 TaxID=2057793 RepID=UPI001C57CDB9|nr:asparagine synthetase B family protein [Actinomyces sp. 594]MBW3068835.1 asparagine synthetase B family protein [Actinomyces sp. 594]